MGTRGTTYVIKRVVGLSVPHVGRRPPFVHLAGNYGVEFDRRGVPTRGRGTGRRPALGRSRDRAMAPLPLSAVRPPLLSPVTYDWSDVWVIDKLHKAHGETDRVSCKRGGRGGLDERTSLKARPVATAPTTATTT